VQIHRVKADFLPVRLGHFLELAIGFQAPFEHPVRLSLDLGESADHVVVETRLKRIRLDVGHKTGLVFVPYKIFRLVGFRHGCDSV
jgi:hypothetical protein